MIFCKQLILTSSFTLVLHLPNFPMAKDEGACQFIETEFEQDGIVVLPKLLSPQELTEYQKVCQQLLSGEIDASMHRHDLGSHAGKLRDKENITQIMWPSSYIPGLNQSVLYRKLENVAKTILGSDMVMDFDMIIAKPSFSPTPTPWHQDESYWLDMPDKRSVSFWVAMQDVDVSNGCMWYVRGSHKKGLRQHRKVAEGHHINCCSCSEEEGQPQPLPAGGGIGHHGRTLHYSRGNFTDAPRIAYIINFRPQAMVEFERNNGFDHGLKGLESIRQTQEDLER